MLTRWLPVLFVYGFLVFALWQGVLCLFAGLTRAWRSATAQSPDHSLMRRLAREGAKRIVRFCAPKNLRISDRRS